MKKSIIYINTMFIKPILGHQDIFCIICSGNHNEISGKMTIIITAKISSKKSGKALFAI